MAQELTMRGLTPPAACYYLPKSADRDELAAHPERAGAAPAMAWVLEVGPRRLLPPGGDAIALSQQDVTVLHALMAEPERIVSRQQIVQSLGENFLLFPLRAAVDKPVDKC
jgi:DNA-binding response OmpR family regulator